MEVKRQKKVTYERLSQVEAVHALVVGILKVEPRRTIYKAANYVLECRQYQDPAKTVLTLSDQKDRLIATIEINNEFPLPTLTTIKLGPSEGEPSDDVSYTRTKGALRQFLTAIVFTDYTDQRNFSPKTD